jgi:aromatic-L-amino-acid decarboxylase
VERDGLAGAPPVQVVVAAERHVTIDAALRFLGLGSGRVRVVAADGQGRMDPAALARTLAGGQGPAIVCAQAGNVNSGGRRPAGGDLRDRPRPPRPTGPPSPPWPAT